MVLKQMTESMDTDTRVRDSESAGDEAERYHFTDSP